MTPAQADDEPVVVVVADDVATITLNRPDKRNALTPAMVSGLCDGLRRARIDSDVSVVVITGAGDRAFCAGADLSDGQLGDIAGPGDGPARYREFLREQMHAIQRELRLLDKPYLAAINGAAMGAGMDLASMADIRFAADTARFAMSYVKVGAVPGDGGAFYLPRLVGLSRALHLLWTGETFAAQDALDWGYVHEVVPSADLMEHVHAYARRLAEGPGVAIQLTKHLVRRSSEATEDQALELAALAMQVAMGTEDALEGPRAFAERRSPKFLGR